MKKSLRSLKILLIVFFSLLTTKAFGQVSTYTFAQSSGTYTSLPTSTTLFTTGWDDDVASVTIPFTYNFNGVGYTSAYVNSNGYITFGTTASGTTDYNAISETTAYAGAIAAFSRDLFSNTSPIVYGIIGSAPNRVFVIQWSNASRYRADGTSLGDTINFQIRLYETSNVTEVRYGNNTTTYSNNVLANRVQVGLRGTSNSDFNNRYDQGSNQFSWTTDLISGTLNTNNVNFRNGTPNPTVPANGLTFTWTPPACTAKPTALTSSLIGSTTATISWSAASPAPASGYEYYYNTTGTTPVAGTTVTGTTAAGLVTKTLTGLTAATKYYFWVRSNCGTAKSAWVSGGSFTTSQIPATLPYTQNFSGANSFTFVNATQANQWVTGSAAGNPANSIYISNDAGVTNAYTVGTASVTQVYRDITIPSGTTTASFSFDWKANGESTYDFLRVWLVPTSFVPTAGTQIVAGAGRIQVGANFGLQTTWQTYSNATLELSTFANSTMRLVFEWKNDSSGGTQTPAAVDNVNITLPVPCSGTPNAGTGLANGVASGTGNVSSSITLSATGLSTGSGFTYQWYSSPDGSTWNPIAGATTAIYVTTAAATISTTYYQLRTTCTNSNITSTSSTASFVTTYCSSTVNTSTNAAANYIKQVDFLGTLLDTSNSSGAATTAPYGYTDFRSLTPKSIQADGNGMNLYIASNISGLYRVWVDWDKDGSFDNTVGSTELVYDSGSFGVASTTAGIVIPSGLSPGDYTMRIRVNGSSSGAGITGDSTASPCGVLNYPGETEDYTFTVIANCAANILTAPRTARCGTGSVSLAPTATAGTTEFRWYTSETGGLPFATSVATGTTTITTSYNTPSITTTTTYYVTAWNGTCESLVRSPMVAVVNQTPNITFTPSSAEICGANSTVALSATGSNEIDYLINENFESVAGLNGFTNEKITGSPGTNAYAAWQIRTSIFKPSLNTWFPAISSGINGNKFVVSTSDVGSTASGSENALVSPVINTTPFLNLTLSFKMYYSRYFPNETTKAKDFVSVEVSTDGGLTYPNVIENITSDVGIGTKFAIRTYDLTTYKGQSNLRFRIRYHGEFCDGVAIDNIDLFGEKPLTPSFTFTSDNPIDIYTDAEGTTAYVVGTPASTVYIKPSATQSETYTSWNVSATASLTNGCNATGGIRIANNSKFWNSASTDWNSANWKPNTAVPTADKCVIIQTPVTLGTATEGLAKNLTVKSGGSLLINGDLTVTDGIKNEGLENDLVIASDANLKQENDVLSFGNSGRATAKRKITFKDDNRTEYNYLISPLVGQSLKTIYPGVPTTATYPYILYHNETNNFFYNSSGAYIPGRGLAVKEPKKSDVAFTNMDAEFKGELANGIINFVMAYTNSAQGYNLVGNPYPSNINLQTLYTLNGGGTAAPKIASTFQFWDNAANDTGTQAGNGYSGRAYAMYNASNDTGIEAGYLLIPSQVLSPKKPNNIVKVGQGFMVRAQSGGKSLVFNNSIRTITKSGASFFSKDAVPMDRYWLKLISPADYVNNIAVVYYEGGADSFGMDDSELIGGSSDMLYSLADNHLLQIEGKPTFTNSDKIILGTKHFTTGNYTFSLGDQEGIFSVGQTIYLKDKQAGTITNLSEGSYTFAANSGVNTGRFEIVYVPETVLATNGDEKENIIVYRDGNDFVVKAQNKKITNLEVYDTAGRLILQLKPNSLKAIIPADKMVNGVYILKINQNGEVTTKKIIR